MGLESATFFNQLVPTNPPSSDQKKQGDDHLRLIKATAQNTFPNADKAFYFPKSPAAKTANYAIVAADMHKVLLGDAQAGTFNFTLPALAPGDDGWSVRIVKVNANANVVGVVGTMNGGANFNLTAQYESILLIWTGTAWLRFHAPLYSAAGALELPADITITGKLSLTGTIAKMPLHTTAQRPVTPVTGDFGINTDLDLFEFYSVGAWRQPSLAQPIAGGYRALVIKNNAVTPNTQIDLDADALTVETVGGIAYRLLGIDITIDFATNGANGLDAGGLANNTSYVSMVIYNPTTDTIAGLGTTEANWIAGTYTLPTGYTALAKFGWHRTNASAQFKRTMQYGNRGHYIYTGSGTGVFNTIAGPKTRWTSESIATFVPASASHIQLACTPRNSGQCGAAPNTSWPTAVGNAGAMGYGIVTSQTQGMSIIMPLESLNIAVAIGASEEIIIVGWEDNL